MVAPVIYSIVLSFYAQQKSGLGFGEAKTAFVGLENYLQVLQSESFVGGIARLGLYCLIYIPCMVGGAVIFALLLDATVARARKLFQLLRLPAARRAGRHRCPDLGLPLHARHQPAGAGAGQAAASRSTSWTPTWSCPPS